MYHITHCTITIYQIVKKPCFLLQILHSTLGIQPLAEPVTVNLFCDTHLKCLNPVQEAESFLCCFPPHLSKYKLQNKGDEHKYCR